MKGKIKKEEENGRGDEERETIIMEEPVMETYSTYLYISDYAFTHVLPFTYQFLSNSSLKNGWMHRSV